MGEILVKFHPTANNEIVKIIENEGGEAVMPDLIDFFQYCFYNTWYEHEHFDMKQSSVWLCNFAIWFVDFLRKDMIKALKASKRFDRLHQLIKLLKKQQKL